jgi:hypothetical protein
VIDEFSKLDRKTVSDLGLAPVMSECFAQKGEFDRAISFAEENVKSYIRPSDLYVQIARVHEVYRFDSLKALTAYESAVKASTEVDAKEWLVRKVQWLKNQGAPTKVGDINYQTKVEGDAP